jgi:Holliday junction DNA helicase RuvB
LKKDLFAFIGNKQVNEMKLFNRWRKKNDDNNLSRSEFIVNRKHSKPTIEEKLGLFADIFGYEDIKEIFDMTIKANRPVHVLLVGPPASAKSLFMSSLTKLERSYYAIGSSSTKSGIFDYLFEHRPRYFIIDEIEKMNKRDQTSLLNLMESGVLSELKHRQHRTTQLKTWVFASANSVDNILPPLLTRFTAIHLKPYTEEEFVKIAVEILERQEGIDREIAALIAEAVFNKLKSANIRECIRIARLARDNLSEIQKVIDTFLKYSDSSSNNSML